MSASILVRNQCLCFNPPNLWYFVSAARANSRAETRSLGVSDSFQGLLIVENGGYFCSPLHPNLPRMLGLAKRGENIRKHIRPPICNPPSCTAQKPYPQGGRQSLSEFMIILSFSCLLGTCTVSIKSNLLGAAGLPCPRGSLGEWSDPDTLE